MAFKTTLPEPRRPVPWGLSYAFIIFLIFALAAPLVADGLLYPFHCLFPVFEDEASAASAASKVEKESSDNADDADVQKGTNTGRETTNDFAEQNEPEGYETVTIKEFSEKGDVGTAPSQSQSHGKDSVFDPENIATQHPLARLLIRSYFTPYFKIVVVLFFLAVVCFAPLAEEFVFRVVIQGATENALDVTVAPPNPDAPTAPIQSVELTDEERSRLRQINGKSERVRRIRVVFAILAPALLFAALHAGVPEDPENPQPLNDLFDSLVTSSVSCLLTVIFGVVLLIKKTGARRADFGLPSNGNLLAFVLRWSQGVGLLALGAPFIFGVSHFCEQMFPGTIVAPIPILIFALYEGVVYYRSHQFATILGMHMTLNFVSFVTLMSLVLGD